VSRRQAPALSAMREMAWLRGSDVARRGKEWRIQGDRIHVLWTRRGGGARRGRGGVAMGHAALFAYPTRRPWGLTAMGWQAG